MARIQLRDTTILMQDGLSGTCKLTDPGTVPGATDIDVTVVVLNTDVTTKVPVGARFTVSGEADAIVHTVTATTETVPGTTDNITFTPVLGAGTATGDDITFLPQRINIKIGDGDLSWTETREMIYDLDRDLLDTVRQGAEVPVDVSLNFTFEYITTQTNKQVTPVDALKRIGGASDWVSSSADLCEPYAVDIYVIHNLPCGTDHDQDFLFQDFRWESLEYSIRDASVAVSGKCNVSSISTTRAASFK